MKYMGSKARYAKYILPIILKDRKENQWYVEPFVGGCNAIDKVSGNRIGNDINQHLIEMWKSLQNGWTPTELVSEDYYKYIKDNQKEFINANTAFVGIGCSYSGKWFGGYARGNDNNGNPRNYAKESADNIQKQKDFIKDVIFTHGNYYDMEIPDNSIIYCDPPYQGTTKYKDNFNHSKFWDWCDDMVKKGHKVFVSEYNAPDSWNCVWQKEVNNSLTKNTGAKKGVEKLFTK